MNRIVFYFVLMAKQIGLLRITGTTGEICFYRMDGNYYARQKSSLTGKRVKTDPAFAETMKYAERMAYASKMASKIYRETVPKEKRSREKYREIVGMVMRELTTNAHEMHSYEYGSFIARTFTNEVITDSRVPEFRGFRFPAFFGHSFLEQKVSYMHLNSCSGNYNLAAKPGDYLKLIVSTSIFLTPLEVKKL